MPLDAELQKSLYRDMLLCRRFEERTAQSYGQEKIRGFCHLYIGQEAVAVGSMRAARPDDYFIATYREHAHALVAGCPPREVMAELYGKATGSSKGFGGSMHIFDVDHHFMGGHGIVGGHTPLAAGFAFATKYLGKDSVSICYLGDAAINQGAFHEILNIAALWKLPVIFIVENNLYGMGTAVHRAIAGEIVHRGEMYGIPSQVVDGMDVEAMYEATKACVDRARAENTPSFIEARCYRFRGHSMSDAGTYRTKDEVLREQQRDPLELLKARMLSAGVVTEDWLKAQDKEMREICRDAADFADKSPLPELSEVDRYVLV